MPPSTEELDLLSDLQARSFAEGRIFWNGEDELAVFDPHAAQQINALNYSDLTLPDKLGDLLRGRSGEPVSWKQVRAAWTAQLHRLADGEEVGRLAARMSDLLDQRLDQPLDLVWVAQEVCGRALLPMVVTGLSPADTARVARAQMLRMTGLVTSAESRQPLGKVIRTVLIQTRAGLALRRELRGRATGRRPRQLDLTDPLVDLLPVLGLDRAIPALTAMLTAIAGPPGAAAACLFYELTRHPDWAARLAGELAPIPLKDLYAAPARVAPLTHRFVKETLRMWSPPSLMTQSVRTDIDHEQVCLKTGQRYLLSPYLIHHDPRNWKDPDTFDPDRWIPGAERGPCNAASYVPFGWAPKACIGGGLGTTLLMMLCNLLCTRYRIQLADPASVRITLAAAPLPLNFRGTITRR